MMEEPDPPPGVEGVDPDAGGAEEGQILTFSWWCCVLGE